MSSCTLDIPLHVFQSSLQERCLKNAPVWLASPSGGHSRTCCFVPLSLSRLWLYLSLLCPSDTCKEIPHSETCLISVLHLFRVCFLFLHFRTCYHCSYCLMTSPEFFLPLAAVAATLWALSRWADYLLLPPYLCLRMKTWTVYCLYEFSLFCVLCPTPTGEGTTGVGHKVGLIGLVLASVHWGWCGRSELAVVQATAVTLPSLDEILGVQTCVHRCGCCPVESHDCSACWSVARQFGEGAQVCSGQSRDQGLQCHPANIVPNAAPAEKLSRAQSPEVRRSSLFLVAFGCLSLLYGHIYFVSCLTFNACFDFFSLLADAFGC